MTCGDGESYQHSALAEISNCNNLVSTYWNNIETLHQLSQNISNSQCQYNFSNQDEITRRYEYHKNNIPCNQLPECSNNGCIQIGPNTNAVNPTPIKCTPRNLCLNNQYISNPNTSLGEFTCESVQNCQPGTYVASNPFTKQILNQTQNISNRECRRCLTNQYSSNENSSQCSNFVAIGPTQNIVEDAKYYVSNGIKYYVSDRLLTNVFYYNDGRGRKIKLKINSYPFLLEKDNTNNYWHTSINIGNVTVNLKMIHASPDNKILIKNELEKASTEFDFPTQSDFDSFYNTHLVKTIDYENSRKRDYYKWILLVDRQDSEGSKFNLNVIDDNITQQYVSKYITREISSISPSIINVFQNQTSFKRSDDSFELSFE